MQDMESDIIQVKHISAAKGMAWRKLSGWSRLLAALAAIVATPRDKTIVLGLYLRDVPKLPALFDVAPDKFRFINLNFLRPDRGFTERAFNKAIALLRPLLRSRRCTTYIWGSYDKRFLGLDLGTVFPDVHRMENGIVASDERTGRFRKAFLIDGTSGYFSGLQATELEKGLQNLDTPNLAADAANAAIVKHVIHSRISKYNYNKPIDQKPGSSDILIAGQVEHDAALLETIRLGESASDLVALVHEHLVPHTPGATVFFKPHPRSKRIEADIADVRRRWPAVKIIEPEVSIVDCLDYRPILATYNSTVGLEAALRGCQVHCFAIAFYSGWGFTVDHVPCDRRTNLLTAEDVFLYIIRNRMRFVDTSLKNLVPAEVALGIAATAPQLQPRPGAFGKLETLKTVRAPS
jgi:capsular polysaccharide export protein